MIRRANERSHDAQLQEFRTSLKSKEASLSQLELEKRKVDLEIQQLRDQLALEQSICNEMTAGKHKAELESKGLQERLAATTASAEAETQELRKLLSNHEQAKFQQQSPSLDQKMTSQSAELDQLRRVVDFYKTTSEQLSKEKTDMLVENKSLQDSLSAKDLEIQDSKSQIRSLRNQIARR